MVQWLHMSSTAMQGMYALNIIFEYVSSAIILMILLKNAHFRSIILCLEHV